MTHAPLREQLKYINYRFKRSPFFYSVTKGTSGQTHSTSIYIIYIKRYLLKEIRRWMCLSGSSIEDKE